PPPPAAEVQAKPSRGRAKRAEGAEAKPSEPAKPALQPRRSGLQPPTKRVVKKSGGGGDASTS
ncbi:MAG: hypothetical protein ACREVP_08700, partial [Burkholderiales bacterium]